MASDAVGILAEQLGRANWVELRGDFFKISSENQRSPPVRADSIGHSVAVLEFLTRLGTLSTAALV